LKREEERDIFSLAGDSLRKPEGMIVRWHLLAKTERLRGGGQGGQAVPLLRRADGEVIIKVLGGVPGCPLFFTRRPSRIKKNYP
jgi:hypothetical protein